MKILKKHYGLDALQNSYHQRYYAILNENRETILIVQANIYFPDCFKWKKLYEKGWSVHVIGQELPKGVIDGK